MIDVNESWMLAARCLSRYRGALLGGIGTAAAVALTLAPTASAAGSSIRFAFWCKPARETVYTYN